MFSVGGFYPGSRLIVWPELTGYLESRQKNGTSTNSRQGEQASQRLFAVWLPTFAQHLAYYIVPHHEPHEL